MKTKKERRATKRRKKNADSSEKYGSRPKVGRKDFRLLSDESSPPEFFRGCSTLTEDEYADFWALKSSSPFSWTLPREEFVADACKIGTGFFPACFELHGDRKGRRVKLVVNTALGDCRRYYRFVDPDFDLSPFVGTAPLQPPLPRGFR